MKTGRTLKLAMTALIALSLIGVNLSYGYDTHIINGNFETGDLTGWTADGINDGFAAIVSEESLFSANNTFGLTLDGDFALNIRSSGPAPVDSVGILKSDFFIAGYGIDFLALSENDDYNPSPNPVTFSVGIFNSLGNVLLSQIITPNIVTLGTYDGRDGIFSKHTLDTSAFIGETVQLEFRQHTNVPGAGFFTLIDDIVNKPSEPVTGTPEPATLLLVGLGLIGLIKFRKKSYRIV